MLASPRGCVERNRGDQVRSAVVSQRGENGNRQVWQYASPLRHSGLWQPPSEPRWIRGARVTTIMLVKTVRDKVKELGDISDVGQGHQ